MSSTSLQSDRESRAEIVAAVDEIDKILSEELSQISIRKRELDQQIEQTQKRLTQQITSVRNQVRANVKASIKAEEKIQKQKKRKVERPRQASPSISLVPSTPPHSSGDMPVISRAAAAQLFVERAHEREAQLISLINSRETYLLSRIPTTVSYERIEVYEPLPHPDVTPVNPPQVPVSKDQKRRIASLIRVRIPEFSR